MGKKKLTIGGKKMQVYLALYGLVDGKTKYLVAQKNKYAYFYGEEIFPLGKYIEHGAKSWVFPGGKAKNRRYIFNAYREFKEETGIAYSEIEKDGAEIGIGDSKYIVYFVKCKNLQELVNTAKFNLHKQNYVTDDELDNVEIVTANEAIRLFEKDLINSSWFKEAITTFIKKGYTKRGNAIWKINLFPDI